MNSPKKLKKGFTLIEVILAVSIIAIMSVIGSANYSSLRNLKALNSMVDRIVADISYTMERSKTQESGLQWWMNFQDTAGTDYYLICSGMAYLSGGPDCGSGGTISKTTQITQGLSISFSTPGSALDLIFEKSTGLPIDSFGGQIASAITITVSLSSDLYKQITIDLNGRIDVDLPPPPTSPAPQSCRADQVGTPPNCQCPTGQSGNPCSTPPPPSSPEVITLPAS